METRTSFRSRQRGQTMAETVVALTVMTMALFIPIEGQPLYLVLAEAIKTHYAAFSAALSLPLTPY